MPSRRLTPDARRFLAEHVHSVLQLELVLLLAADPVRAWTATAASSELRAPEPWTGAQLAELTALGVITPDGDGARYAVAGPWAAAIDEIAEAFQRRRRAVIDAIFGMPEDELRSFSDAFRLRPHDDEDRR